MCKMIDLNQMEFDQGDILKALIDYMQVIGGKSLMGIINVAKRNDCLCEQVELLAQYFWQKQYYKNRYPTVFWTDQPRAIMALICT